MLVLINDYVDSELKTATRIKSTRKILSSHSPSVIGQLYKPEDTRVTRKMLTNILIRDRTPPPPKKKNKQTTTTRF